jgi:hypothetical protein
LLKWWVLYPNGTTKAGVVQICAEIVKWEKIWCAKKAIKEKSKKLEILQKNESGEDGPEVKKLQKEIDFLLEQEDIRWKQWTK